MESSDQFICIFCGSLSDEYGCPCSTSELCGNDAHYGYDCPSHIPFVYNQDLWLEDKQPEEKTNTDCLVKEREKVHLGIKVGANIMVTGVPGQKGAEGNVAEKKKGVYES
ncbi:hypothetical protein Tco_1256190 [Tanacetum coccineum]